MDKMSGREHSRAETREALAQKTSSTSKTDRENKKRQTRAKHAQECNICPSMNSEKRQGQYAMHQLMVTRAPSRQHSASQKRKTLHYPTIYKKRQERGRLPRGAERQTISQQSWRGPRADKRRRRLSCSLHFTARQQTKRTNYNPAEQ